MHSIYLCYVSRSSGTTTVPHYIKCIPLPPALRQDEHHLIDNFILFLPANDDSSFVHDWKGWHVDIEPLLCRDGWLNGGSFSRRPAATCWCVGRHSGSNSSKPSRQSAPCISTFTRTLNLLHKNFRGEKGDTETTGWKMVCEYLILV